MSRQATTTCDLEESSRPSFSRNGTVLHPQPTKDPLDPLNWTNLRKHSILGIVMGMYFMFTYITTTTVPSFPEIQNLYNLTYSQVNWTVAMPSLGLALGPLFWSSLSDIYGRRLIFIVGTTIALLATIGTAFANNYITYLAARACQGFGASPAGTVGMAIINDLFFDYERGQKFGLWILAINSGLLVGPTVGGFIGMVSLFWVNGFIAILFGALLVLELAFLPETLYPRKYMLVRDFESTHSQGIGNTETLELKRTTTLPFINLMAIPGVGHTRLWDSSIRFGFTFRYPVVVSTVLVFCFSWYWWILSIITLIPAAYAQYNPSIQGLLFVGLLLGTWFAELFCSGKLSDSIIDRLNRRNGDTQLPETRLWLVYPAALLSASGLILWGISIDHHCHWMVGQVAFFLFAMGLQTGNTIVSTYIVDCYPLQSMSVITFYSVFLDISALVNPFFIVDWVTAWGYTNAFAAQGIITFCVAVPLIVLVHKYGPLIRVKSGEPSWVNPEYQVFQEQERVSWGLRRLKAGFCERPIDMI